MRLLVSIFALLFTFHLMGQNLYDSNEIQEVKITFAEENWEELLDSLKKEGEKGRLLGNVAINGTAYPQSGIRYKGNSSYFSTSKSEEQKLPFNIKLTYTDKTHLTPKGYKTLKLSNVFRDPSFVREILSYEIARNYMPASKCNFVQLYINDEYWGLYNSSQSVDGKFLEDHYGEKEGTFFKCDPPDSKAKTHAKCKDSHKASLTYVGGNLLCYKDFYELKSDTVLGWEDLVELAKALKKPDDKLEELLNIDQTLWMLAFNNLLVNLDSYTGFLCHNYYLYKGESGQFNPIIWDLNMSFGGFRLLDEPKQLTTKELQKMSPFVHYKEQNDWRPLITNLLENDLYRKIYMAHMNTMIKDHFSNGAYLIRAKEIQTQIDSLVKKDQHKLYSYEDFSTNLDTTVWVGKSEIIGIKELMESRTAYLKGHPIFQKDAPEISQVQHEQQDSLVQIVTTTSGIENCWLFYRYGKNDRFRRIAMEENGVIEEDESVKEMNWVKKVKYGIDLQYYVVAEAEKTATLSPENAANVFYEVKKTVGETAKTGD